MSSEQIATAIAGAGLVVNVIVLGFLVFQVRLLRDQVLQAKDAFVYEQGRSRSQATLEFLTSTLERRHGLYKAMPSETQPEKIKAFLDRVSIDQAAESAYRLKANESKSSRSLPRVACIGRAAAQTSRPAGEHKCSLIESWRSACG